jgi:hypothetical protein
MPNTYTLENFMNKIKLLCMLVFVSLAVAGLSAQVGWKEYPEAYGAGDIAVQAGIGLGYPVVGDTKVPPIGIAVDVAVPVSDIPLSFGGYVGYTSSSEEYSFYGSDWGYDYSYYIFGARVAYHPNFNIDKLDAYTGILLGYAGASVKETGTAATGYSSASAGGLVTGAYVGGRYFFLPNVAGYAELGWAIGYLNLGLAVKF